MRVSVIKKVRSASKKRLILRERLWPNVDENELWLRKDRVGFTTIPRTMALIGRIMDQLSGKGFPVFSTYFSLWCRVFDEGIVDIRNQREFAFESGFSGPRGEVTWRGRMRTLELLGFIKLRAGVASEMQYVLIMNPIIVIENAYIKSDLPEDAAYNALMNRLIEVGADDLDDDGTGDDE